MFDVFLGGTAQDDWRREFKSAISSDITIFDPADFDCDKSNESIANLTARELYHLEECETIVFYLLRDTPWTVIELVPIMAMMTESVGRGLQVIVCRDEKDEDLSYLKLYFEFHGIHAVDSLEELITSVEENVAQVELCGVDEDLLDV